MRPRRFQADRSLIHQSVDHRGDPGPDESTAFNHLESTILADVSPARLARNHGVL